MKRPLMTNQINQKKRTSPKKKNSDNKKPPYSNKHTHPVKKTKPKKPEIHCPTPKQTWKNKQNNPTFGLIYLQKKLNTE